MRVPISPLFVLIGCLLEFLRRWTGSLLVYARMVLLSSNRTRWENCPGAAPYTKNVEAAAPADPLDSLSALYGEICFGLVRQKHRVDHVDHAVRLGDIRDCDFRHATLFVGQDDVLALHAGPQLSAAYGGQQRLSVAGLDC